MGVEGKGRGKEGGWRVVVQLPPLANHSTPRHPASSDNLSFGSDVLVINL